MNFEQPMGKDNDRLTATVLSQKLDQPNSKQKGKVKKGVVTALGLAGALALGVLKYVGDSNKGVVAEDSENKQPVPTEVNTNASKNISLGGKGTWVAQEDREAPFQRQYTYIPRGATQEDVVANYPMTQEDLGFLKDTVENALKDQEIAYPSAVTELMEYLGMGDFKDLFDENKIPRDATEGGEGVEDGVQQYQYSDEQGRMVTLRIEEYSEGNVSRSLSIDDNAGNNYGTLSFGSEYGNMNFRIISGADDFEKMDEWVSLDIHGESVRYDRRIPIRNEMGDVVSQRRFKYDSRITESLKEAPVVSGSENVPASFIGGGSGAGWATSYDLQGNSVEGYMGGLQYRGTRVAQDERGNMAYDEEGIPTQENVIVAFPNISIVPVEASGEEGSENLYRITTPEGTAVVRPVQDPNNPQGYEYADGQNVKNFPDVHILRYIIIDKF